MSATADLSDVRWSEWADDPYPLYRTLRDEHPLYADETSGTYVITRYDDVAAVLKDNARFSNQPLAQLTGDREQMSPIREADAPQHTT
jgi:cytochrome P450